MSEEALPPPELIPEPQFNLPADFVPAESMLSGIEAYVPPPVEEQEAEVVAFACPNCLAKTAYSAVSRGLTCTNCGYFEPLKTEGTDDQFQKFPFDSNEYKQYAHGWGQVREEIECQNCYAKISLSEGQLTTKCPFCASRKVVHHTASQDEMRPLSVIPFTKTIEDVAPSVKEWLGNSWMLPKTLRANAVMKSFSGIYLPFWLIDSDVLAKWRVEHSTEHMKGIPTEWEWRSGKVKHKFDNLIVTGTKHVTAGLLETIADYNLKELVAYEPSYLVGWQAQAYESTLNDAHLEAREVARFEIEEMARKEAHPGMSGFMRNFDMKTEYSNEAWRYILLPVYLSAFTFQEKTYQVVVNGQTGSVAGSRPVNWFIVYMAMIASFIPGVLFCCLITGIVFGADEVDLGICVLPLVGFAASAFFAMRFHTLARKIANPDNRNKSDFEKYVEGVVPWQELSKMAEEARND